MDRILLTAVTNVTLGVRIHPPGATLAADAAVATELIACGAARRLDAPAADPDAHDDAPLPLEHVSGIGPVTAGDLREAGVADLTALAALTDDQVAALPLDTTTQTKILADWRAQAAALLDA